MQRPTLEALKKADSNCSASEKASGVNNAQRLEQAVAPFCILHPPSETRKTPSLKIFARLTQSVVGWVAWFGYAADQFWELIAQSKAAAMRSFFLESVHAWGRSLWRRRRFAPPLEASRGRPAKLASTHRWRCPYLAPDQARLWGYSRPQQVSEPWLPTKKSCTNRAALACCFFGRKTRKRKEEKVTSRYASEFFSGGFSSSAKKNFITARDLLNIRKLRADLRCPSKCRRLLRKLSWTWSRITPESGAPEYAGHKNQWLRNHSLRGHDERFRAHGQSGENSIHCRFNTCRWRGEPN